MIDGGPTTGDGHDPAAAPSMEGELQRSSAAFLLELENIEQMEVRKARVEADDPSVPPSPA